jgi:hypothetical protein
LLPSTTQFTANGGVNTSNPGINGVLIINGNEDGGNGGNGSNGLNNALGGNGGNGSTNPFARNGANAQPNTGGGGGGGCGEGSTYLNGFGGKGGSGIVTLIFDPIISDICFPGMTPIVTDQGIIPISKINPEFHTINKKPIEDITKTLSVDKYLICFKKNSLGKNIPSEDTNISENHKIYYKGKMLKAKTFAENFKNVVKINYSGEFMYNVLMKEKSIIHVNNLICETLDPNCEFVALYTRNCKYTPEFRDKYVALLKYYKTKNEYTPYNKSL